MSTPLSSRKGDIPDQQIERFNLVEIRGGIRNWELKAEKAEVFDERSEILLEKVQVRYYEDGEVSSMMIADRGRIDQKTENGEVSSNVILSSSEGIKLETEKLWWNNSKGKVYTNQPVRITTREEDEIEGIGFEASPDLKEVIVNNVHGVVRNVRKVEERLNIKWEKENE